MSTEYWDAHEVISACSAPESPYTIPPHLHPSEIYNMHEKHPKTSKGNLINQGYKKRKAQTIVIYIRSFNRAARQVCVRNDVTGEAGADWLLQTVTASPVETQLVLRAASKSLLPPHTSWNYPHVVSIVWVLASLGLRKDLAKGNSGWHGSRG